MLINKILRRNLAIVLTLLISFSIIGASKISVYAAFSSGSGTKKDPYLIKTPDDLYHIRDGLSAHYKLAATIDMAGYKSDSKLFNGGFVPIGDDSTKPFSGSLVCDLGSDGLPLYSILNLNIYNAKGDIYNHDWYSPNDYPDAMGQNPPFFYQTGLFGNTNNAYISNIYLLNVNVYSSVVGQHDGRYADGSEASLISYKSFMDEQGTGGLIGVATNSSVSHCAVTGSITGKTSSHAGLIGRCNGTSVTSSYVDVNIDTGGCWSVGGFIGSIFGNSVVNKCASFGKLSASLDGYGKMQSFKQNPGNGAGGFVGSMKDSFIRDSFSTMALSSKTRGNNFYGDNIGNSTLSNIYTSGVYEGKTSAPEGSSNDSNCYISNATNGLQADFKSASPDELTKYFITQDGWKAGDNGYPVLSSVNIVSDTSIYIPGGERETKVVVAEEPQNSQSDTVSENQTEQGKSTDSQQSGETKVETVNSDDNKINTVQLTLIVLLSVMIVAISALTVVMVYNTLQYKKNHTPIEDYDEGVRSDE